MKIGRIFGLKVKDVPILQGSLCLLILVFFYPAYSADIKLHVNHVGIEEAAEPLNIVCFLKNLV